MPNKVCCFSGHRILNFINDELSVTKFKNLLYIEIESAIMRGYDYFINGMALGFDLICAETVLDLKKIYKNIHLELALPCLDQNEFWQDKEIQRYNNIYNNADSVFIVSPKYTQSCMLNRNKYMVKKSSLLIAYCKNYKSGSFSTLKFAEKHGIEIINLYDIFKN